MFNDFLKHELPSKTHAFYTQGEIPQDFISLEYEISFSPSTENARMIYQTYKDRISGSPSREALLNAIRVDLMDLHGFEIQDEEDGGGLEFIIPIATMKVHQILKPKYNALLKHLKQLGFTYNLAHAGIHNNVDYSLFGDSRKEQIESILFFIKWVYYNYRFILSYSRREYHATQHADMYCFLDNPFGTISEDELETRLHTSLAQFKKDLSSNKGALTNFNINLSKYNRKCLEIRWFNSTLNIQHFMSIIEFMPAFMNFYNSPSKSFNLKDFCSHVKSHAIKYPDLYLDLLSNPYSYPYSVIGVSQLKSNGT